MSKIKTILNFNKKPIKVYFKNYQKFFLRTDHIICELVGDNAFYYVYCKHVPIEIGYLFTFNAGLYTPSQSKHKATTILKNMNLKKRLWKL